MTLTLKENELHYCLQIHSKKLTDSKKTFILNSLKKHGICAAYKALYVMLFVIKDEKELLIYKL